jgi:hypothetical protein
VGWTQIVFGAALVVVLLFVALLYGVRQIVALRRMRLPEELPPGEWNYQRSQARRRLVMSFLLLVLAVMLAVALIYLENPAEQLKQTLEQQGEEKPLDPEQRGFARLYAIFWIIFLLVLMAVVLLAALDFWATRRYGIRLHRKLIADRRDMIEREVSRLRQERNGHN